MGFKKAWKKVQNYASNPAVVAGAAGLSALIAPSQTADKVKGAYNDFTGKTAAEEAARRQAELFNSASGQIGQFNSDKYDSAQKGIMDRLVAGNAATIDENNFQEQYAKPLVTQYQTTTAPQLAQNFRSNPWSSSRLKAQQGAAENLNTQITNARYTAQDKADAKQQSALNMLMQNAQNRANVKIGQAGAVQASPSGAQQLMNFMAPANAAAQTALNIAKVGAL